MVQGTPGQTRPQKPCLLRESLHCVRKPRAFKRGLFSVPGKLLSKSLWRDEAAVAAWHADEVHRQCQREGKDCCFSRFEITVLKPVEHFGKGLEEGEVHHD